MATQSDGEEKQQQEKPLSRIFDGNYFEIINVETVSDTDTELTMPTTE